MFLSAEQVLLTTLVVKITIVAALATILVRYHRFRHILIFERRAWPDRLLFALSLGMPLAAGVAVRLLLNYDAADLTLEGAFLAGLIAGPYAGRHRRPDGRRRRRCSPASSSRCSSPSAAASPAAAFARRARTRKPSGTSRRSSSPSCTATSGAWSKTFRSTGRSSCCWRRSRSNCLRQALGWRFSAQRDAALLPAHRAAMIGLVGLARRARRRCSCVATPIKIWNNARIEHRLAGAGKAAAGGASRGAGQPDQPALPVQHADVDLVADPHRSPKPRERVIVKLSGLLRRLLRSRDHFVTLREELESIDEYLDIEVVRFGPQLKVEKQISPDTLDVIVPSMILQPLVENSIKHGFSRKVGGGRITIRSVAQNGHAIIEVDDDGLGMTDERLDTAFTDGIGLSNVNERLSVIYGAALPRHAHAACPATARSSGWRFPT